MATTTTDPATDAPQPRRDDRLGNRHAGPVTVLTATNALLLRFLIDT